MEYLEDKASYWIYRDSFTVITVKGKFSSYVNEVVGQNISSTIRLMMHNNLYYAMIYITLSSFAIYIPRAIIYEPYRLIVWMLILTYILKKKTFKISKLI